jgi:hypothetical protein
MNVFFSRGSANEGAPGDIPGDENDDAVKCKDGDIKYDDAADDKYDDAAGDKYDDDEEEDNDEKDTSTGGGGASDANASAPTGRVAESTVADVVADAPVFGICSPFDVMGISIYVTNLGIHSLAQEVRATDSRWRMMPLRLLRNVIFFPPNGAHHEEGREKKAVLRVSRQ